MPNDKPKYTDIPLGVFASALHIYHDLAHLINDAESDLFEIFIQAYVSRHKTSIETLNAVKTIIARVWQES